MPRRSTPTLAAALEEYLEIRSTHLKATTLANDGALLRKFVREIGPDAQVHTLSARTVERWFVGEATRQLPSSYNKVRARVACFVKFLMSRGWLDADPLYMIKRRDTVQRERLRLSPSELPELPSHTPTERDRAFIITACNTALRASELTALRVRDVDFFNGSLRAKVEKSSLEDVMPITAELDEALRRWFKFYEKDTGRSLEPDWYLFPQRLPGHGFMKPVKGQNGGTWIKHLYGELLPEKRMKNPAEIVQEALRAAGHVIEPGEGCHTLRRSVARAYFDQRAAGGYDGALRETSALLHHKHSHTTENYLGLRTEKLGRDKALRGKPFLSAMVPAAAEVAPIRAVT